MPLEFYKATRENSAELFLAAAHAMLDGVDCSDESCNLAFMTCIPKDADGEMDDGTKVFAPGSTRPISVVDIANRIQVAECRRRSSATRLRYALTFFLWCQASPELSLMIHNHHS